MQDTPRAMSEVEVPPSGKRVFSMAYKRRILDQLDACSYAGEKSALLRREGLYDSYVAKWRQQLAQKDKPVKKSAARKVKSKGGRPPLSDSEREARDLRAENERLKKELERAKLAIAVQKKLCELLESFSPQISDDSSNSKPQRNS